MDKIGYSSNAERRARTRSLIQLGGLMEKAGIVNTFGITLGTDLQQDPAMKQPIAVSVIKLFDGHIFTIIDG